MSPVTASMALLLQADLTSRGHALSLAECEASLARVLTGAAELERRIAARLACRPIDGPLCPLEDASR